MLPTTPTLTNPTAYRGYLFLEVLRSTGEREFPLQLASVLMFIASHNGCQQQDVERGASLSSSSVSRNVSWLADSHRLPHKQGLHLVERRQDLEDHKRWRLFLTPRGEQFVALLDKQLVSPLPPSGKVITFEYDTSSGSYNEELRNINKHETKNEL